MAFDQLGATDVTCIVLAAGSGERFGERKQFLELMPGVRLVDAALDAAFEHTNNVVLVTPRDVRGDIDSRAMVVSGGATRLESVANGLSAVGDSQEVVMVHDAAHPLAPSQVFSDLIEAVRRGADAAVPVLEVSDVIKITGPDQQVTTVGRDGMGLAQVPMAFAARALRAAHDVAHDVELWEDSMLIERSGGEVVAVTGSPWNIHVATREDLAMARVLAHHIRGLSGLSATLEPGSNAHNRNNATPPTSSHGG